MLNPKVSIVILNWNGRKYLEQFLPSVMASRWDNLEVIVADNASDDDSVDFLKRNYPAVRIIQLERNHGFAIGYNLALKQVKSDYYVLLNSDVEVTPDWIAPVIKLMESDKMIGACQPKIRMERQRELFEYAGAAGGWLDYLGYPFARGRVFDVCEVDEGQYDDIAEIFWASGAAMFVRPAVYHGCGGLDEYFFAHQEEIDLCWRMQLAGYLVMVCPQAMVYHVGGGTLPKGNARKVYLNFRNNLIMMAKNMPFWEGFWKLNWRFLLDSVSAWKSLFAGEGIYFWAILRAHLSFIKWLLFKRSRSVFPASKTGKLGGWLGKSVVWQHFIKGKTKFSEIVHE
ncbi:MAG: glycosyltransferase family 2 protein [Gemmatimonadaceae bacterium]|nr:glycosyltransferase family 2 protein [Chitinophagaceae bacterium]